MKRVVTAVLFVIGLSGVAAAHPPSAIDVKIVQDRIELVIVHQVKDPVGHYINEVAVSVNGKKLVSQTFLRQKDAVNQYAVYLFPGLKIGDTVSVEADCNIYGSKKKDSIVP